MTGRCEQGNPFAARLILFQNLNVTADAGRAMNCTTIGIKLSVKRGFICDFH